MTNHERCWKENGEITPEIAINLTKNDKKSTWYQLIKNFLSDDKVSITK